MWPFRKEPPAEPLPDECFASKAIRDWRPSTPPVTDATIDDMLRSNPTLLVHFWAAWNRHDAVMDRAINEVRPRFADRIHFVSCDVDSNVAFAKRCEVANVPFLAVFVRGQQRRPIVGVKTLEALAAELEMRLSEY
jgi:thioredoxin-like negative regulator of GroEL